MRMMLQQRLVIEPLRRGRFVVLALLFVHPNVYMHSLSYQVLDRGHASSFEVTYSASSFFTLS